MRTPVPTAWKKERPGLRYRLQFSLVRELGLRAEVAVVEDSRLPLRMYVPLHRYFRLYQVQVEDQWSANCVALRNFQYCGKDQGYAVGHFGHFGQRITFDFASESSGALYTAPREMATAFSEEPTFIPKEKESNIKVYVRIRPLSKEELLVGDSSAVTVLRDGKTAQVVEEGAGYKLTTRTFKFDGCLGPTVDQDQVMERLRVSKMLDSVLEGYSSTIMACGQTGSGKTYTMSGRDEGAHRRNAWGKLERKEDGLIARSVTYLFDAMDKRRANSDQEKLYTMRASYYEVYNEQV
ncbi:hypothetical protein R1flu_024508 [Riccia fluitans]|uniref:Kinesin motor domain-containing protein n=1 Tax=Riccia fluitans TaxID=41844 RepID=A0ABD1XV40_9MARC